MIDEHWTRPIGEVLGQDFWPSELTIATVAISGSAVVLGSAQRLVGSILPPDERTIVRRTGGGAVWLSPDDTAWVEVLAPAGHWLAHLGAAEGARRIGRALAPVLGDGTTTAQVVDCGGRDPLGSAVCFAGVGPGEVLLDGRKVVGISQRRGRFGVRFQVGVLLRNEFGPLCEHLGAELLGRPVPQAIAECEARTVGLGWSADAAAENLRASMVAGLGGANRSFDQNSPWGGEPTAGGPLGHDTEAF